MVSVIIDHHTLLLILDDVKTFFDPFVVMQVFPDMLYGFPKFQSSQYRQRGIQRDMFAKAEYLKNT